MEDDDFEAKEARIRVYTPRQLEYRFALSSLVCWEG